MESSSKSIKKISITKRPYLVIRTSGQEKQIILEKSKYTLGRENADIIIDKKSVSRKHAELSENWGGYVLIDRKSNNGTFVNNKQITSDHQLRDNDKIRLGQINDPDPVVMIFYNPLSADFGSNGENTAKEGSSEISPESEKNLKSPKALKEIKDINAPIKQRSFLPANPLYRIVMIAGILFLAIGLYFIIKTLIIPDAFNMKISVINPKAQHPGGNIKIMGNNFFPDKSKYTIKFSGSEGIILNVTQKEIFAQIPKKTDPGEVVPELFYEGHLLKTPEITVLENPTIISVEPDILYCGEELTIRGKSFSSQMDENSVCIGDKDARMVSASHKEISAVLPEFEDIKPGEEMNAVLFVKSNLLTSNSIDIKIRKRPVIYISHDFFPENIKDRYILIRNQYIGLFALDSKGKFSTREDRTGSICDNLNSFFSQENRNIDIGYMNDSINLITDNIIVYSIRINSEDIQLYKELNPDAMLDSVKLAKWIAAVLKDYINVTVHNKPPEYTVLSSYGGRVLDYIYDNFNKRSGDFKGITENYISSLKPDYLKYLKEIGIKIPENYCDISGSYTGRAADNLISRPISTGYISIVLNIQPAGNKIIISHKMSLEKTEDSGVFSQEATRNIGTFRIHDLDVFEPYVSFSINLEGSSVRFNGTIMDNGIQGTFARSNKQTGKFVVKK